MSHTINNFENGPNRTAETVPQRSLKEEYNVPTKLR